MNAETKLTNIFNREGIVAVAVQSNDNYICKYKDEKKWENILKEFLNVLSSSEEDSVRGTISSKSVFATKIDNLEICVVWESGHKIAKSIQKIIALK